MSSKSPEKTKPLAPKPRSWVVIGVISLCAAAVGFFAAAARWPRALPPQAYVDSARGFAVALPSGWRAAPASGDGLGDALTLTDGAATISVSVLRPGSPASEQFSASDAQLSGAEPMPLDGSTAQRYEVSGGRTYLPSPNSGKRHSDLEAPAPAYESVEWQGAVVMLPDGERDYAVKFWSEKSDFEKRQPVFDAFLTSFRRVSAPSR